MSAQIGHATAWRVEAEATGEGTIENKPPEGPEPLSWKIEQMADASGAAILGGSARGETHPIPIRIPAAGTYRIWVRHLQTPNKPSGFFTLFRDDTGQAIKMERIDWDPPLLNEHPYAVQPLKAAPDAKPVLAWTSFDVTFERPMDATVSFGPTGGKGTGKVGIDCVAISNDLTFDPQKGDLTKLPIEAGLAPLPAVTPPQGMKPILPVTLHSTFFAGVPDMKDQFALTFINNNSVYKDDPLSLQLGANHDSSWLNVSSKYGIRVLADPHTGATTPELYKNTPAPTGRFVNTDGSISRSFSYSYEPFRKALIEQFAQGLDAAKDNDGISSFSISNEDVGRMDYSDAAKERFHKFLSAQFGTIDKLNTPWGTNYTSFDEVPLPHKPEDSIAAWFAFRKFSGMELVSLIAEKAKLVSERDPKHRPSNGQSSTLSIVSPTFTSSGPLDFEDLISTGFEKSPYFGWDSYSTEDSFIGSDLDFILSIAKDKSVTNSEWDVHTHDPRIASRSYWAMVGKGIKGISTYQMQDNPVHWGYPFWAMLNIDFTPSPKMAAIAQANHEIHHLEPLLMGAKPQHFSKPIALYYSRMDLSLPQTLLDLYGTQIDSPYRVYGILRGMGYPVRWITPRQIEAGELKDVGALALIDVKYVPQAAAQKVADWVHQGGCVIGDQWPGIFDEYGRPQNTIAQMFGVRAKSNSEVATKTPSVKDAKMALQETSTTLYGVEPSVLRALNTGKDISKSVDEMYEQWDATHPIAKELGRWHLSGYGYTSVECTAGSVLGMAAGGPGVAALVVNDYGKGHTLYSALMLGTCYDAGPIRYEWDSAREGTALSRILGAYLRFSGVPAYSSVVMPAPMALKMRVETPLVDKNKNVVIGIISTNDSALSPFSMSLMWPNSAPQPKLLLAAIGGSEQLQKVPFEIKGGKMTLTMPGFDNHATLLALTNSVPLISMQIEGVPRAVSDLLEVTPGSKLTVKATVWNPSPHKLPAGAVTLYGAPGWFSSENKIQIDAIEPYSSSKQISFEVMPPAICSSRTLRPITLKYQADKILSTPATEMVWWSNPQPDNTAKPASAVSKN
ncbi:MAG: alpha-amylase family protein [Chthoniobacterales bacterium]